MFPSVELDARLTVSEVIARLEGVKSGAKDHVMRCATWLLERGVAAGPGLSFAIRTAKNEVAARQLLRDNWNQVIGWLLLALEEGKLKSLPPSER
jgi:hypothetical protein